MGNCTSQNQTQGDQNYHNGITDPTNDNDDDDDENNEDNNNEDIPNETRLLAGTLLGELGVKSLLDRPDGRELQQLWHIFVNDNDDGDGDGDGSDDSGAGGGDRSVHEDENKHDQSNAQRDDASEVYGSVLSSKACAQFLQAISLRCGDRSWQSRWERAYPPPSAAAAPLPVLPSTTDLICRNKQSTSETPNMEECDVLSSSETNPNVGWSRIRTKMLVRRSEGVRRRRNSEGLLTRRRSTNTVRHAMFHKSKYGGATTSSATVTATNDAQPLPISSQILLGEASANRKKTGITFEEVRTKIWDEPKLDGIAPSTILFLQNLFLRRILLVSSPPKRNTTTTTTALPPKPENAGNNNNILTRKKRLLTKEEAIDLANEILNGIDGFPPSRKKRIETYLVKSADNATAGYISNNANINNGSKAIGVGTTSESTIDFVTFLKIVGYEWERYSPRHDDGLYWRHHQHHRRTNKLKLLQFHITGGSGNGSGILPVECPVIHSFAPPRANTPTEILNCGESILTAMLNAIKSANSEIMMTFWEFCLTLPAVRNANLGNDAWIDDDFGTGDGGNDNDADDGGVFVARSKTLLPILKAKAAAGVKTYIILNDVTIAWALVDYAIKVLSGHENIHIVRHPDWTIVSETHHQKFVVVDRSIAVLGGVDWTVARWDLPSHPLFDPDSSIHPGLELPFNGKRFKKSISEYWKSPQVDLTKYRGETACSLWQDVAVCVRGEAAGDVAKNFIERWEHARITSESGILIDPMFKHGRPSLAKMPRIHSKPIINGDTGDVLGSGHSASEVDIAASPMPLYTGGFASRGTASSCKCQIVRSLSGWSGTQGDTEISHYEAWISSINRAESFIYIEQQYFVCSMGVTDAKNRVAEAILERVRHAIEHSKPFRVYVVIPATVYMTIVNHFTRRTLLQDGGRNNGWVKRRNRQREKSLMTRIRILLRKVAPGSYWDGKSAESLLSVCFLSSVGKSMSGRWEVSSCYVMGSNSTQIVCPFYLMICKYVHRQRTILRFENE